MSSWFSPGFQLTHKSKSFRSGPFWFPSFRFICGRLGRCTFAFSKRQPLTRQRLEICRIRCSNWMAEISNYSHHKRDLTSLRHWIFRLAEMKRSARDSIKWLWLKNPVPKWNLGKWKHGTKPAVCPSDRFILSHTQMGVSKNDGSNEPEKFAGLSIGPTSAVRWFSMPGDLHALAKAGARTPASPDRAALSAWTGALVLRITSKASIAPMWEFRDGNDRSTIPKMVCWIFLARLTSRLDFGTQYKPLVREQRRLDFRGLPIWQPGKCRSDRHPPRALGESGSSFVYMSKQTQKGVFLVFAVRGAAKLPTRKTTELSLLFTCGSICLRIWAATAKGDQRGTGESTKEVSGLSS